MKRGLVVGINEFQYRPEAALRGCRNDALAMRAFMHVELGVPETEILYLLDGQAEARRVLDTLAALADRTREGDYLAFAFSSHGTQIPDADGDELDGWHEAVCATDIQGDDSGWTGGYILDKTLRDLLKEVHPGARVEVWLDTCYAGGIKSLAALGMTYGRARMLRPPGGGKIPRRRLGLAPPDQAVIWAACKEAQTSADTILDGRWCGAFTYHFLHQFRPELDRGDILERTRRALVSGDYLQTPQLTCGAESLAAAPVGE